MSSLHFRTNKVGQWPSHLSSVVVVVHSSKEAVLTASKMKRHRHLSSFEWYGTPSVVSYIDLDGIKLPRQQRHVVDVVELLRNHLSMFTRNPNDPQERHEAISNDTWLHNTRTHLERFHTLIHIHHGAAFERFERVAPFRTFDNFSYGYHTRKRVFPAWIHRDDWTHL